MMKKSLIVASLLFASTSAMAENEYFMGVGIGSASWIPEAKVKNNVGTVVQTESNSDSGRVISIHGGTVLSDTHRLSVGYSTYNIEDGADMTSIDLGYAYLIDIGSKNWKPFVSTAYSMSKYTEDLDSDWNKSEFELTTKALMIGVGTDYEIDKHQFITMQYDMSLSTSGSESAILTTGGNDYTVDMEVDKLSRWLVSYNYKF